MEDSSAPVGQLECQIWTVLTGVFAAMMGVPTHAWDNKPPLLQSPLPDTPIPPLPCQPTPPGQEQQSPLGTPVILRLVERDPCASPKKENPPANVQRDLFPIQLLRLAASSLIPVSQILVAQDALHVLLIKSAKSPARELLSVGSALWMITAAWTPPVPLTSV